MNDHEHQETPEGSEDELLREFAGLIENVDVDIERVEAITRVAQEAIDVQDRTDSIRSSTQSESQGVTPIDLVFGERHSTENLVNRLLLQILRKAIEGAKEMHASEGETGKRTLKEWMSELSDIYFADEAKQNPNLFAPAQERAAEIFLLMAMNAKERKMSLREIFGEVLQQDPDKKKVRTTIIAALKQRAAESDADFESLLDELAEQKRKEREAERKESKDS